MCAKGGLSETSTRFFNILGNVASVRVYCLYSTLAADGFGSGDRTVVEMDFDEFEEGLEGAFSDDSESTRSKAKDDMLKSQLDIYGKPSNPLGRKGGKKKKGKKDRHFEEPESEPEEVEIHSRKSKSRTGRSNSEEEAERRRKSRAKKAAELKKALDAGEDEVSLLERLDQSTMRRRSKTSKSKGSLDNEPISITLWVYLLFSIVGLDRSVKYLSVHANPAIVSKVLGIVLIVASFGVKVPQIITVMESKTVAGLSAPKFYSGVLSLTLVVVYHVANKNPFSGWGDSLAVLLQDMTLVGLIWKFSKTPIPVQAGLSVAFVAICGALVALAAKTPADQLWPLPLISTVIAHSGTIPQIIENERNKHTGPQSFITQLMLTLGSLARVFTTLSEMNDPIVLSSFISSVIVQGILLVQILMYWGNTKRVLAKAKKSD